MTNCIISGSTYAGIDVNGGNVPCLPDGLNCNNLLHLSHFRELLFGAETRGDLLHFLAATADEDANENESEPYSTQNRPQEAQVLRLEALLS